jgi:hypothetical protein
MERQLDPQSRRLLMREALTPKVRNGPGADRRLQMVSGRFGMVQLPATLIASSVHARFSDMSVSPEHRYRLTDVALAAILAASLAMLVWARITGARLDKLIEQAVEARGAGNVSAFEGYRESARVLLQLSQHQQPWLLAAYFGLALVLVAMLSRWMVKRRARST